MIKINCPYYYEDDDVRMCEKKAGYLRDCTGCPELEKEEDHEEL